MLIARIIFLALACATVMPADDSPLPPHFQRVSGEYQMTENWAVTLPGEYLRRIEDDSLVLWKKGLTCWTVVYDLKKGETPQERFSRLKDDVSKDAIQRWEYAEALPLRFAYLLREQEEDGDRWALYTFTVGETGHVMMAIYFDQKDDLSEAQGIWMSIAQKRRPNRVAGGS